LLARWIATAEPSAMDTLVRRHGKMVLGVCRRTLGSGPDAEDAFQIAFLVLVTKARSLTRPGQVAGWLHGVAFQVSRRIRSDAARRRRREDAMTTDFPAPELPHDDTGELRAMIDAELDRLPEKYRQPIVLCELEELTLDQAARRLGWPKGTVAGRLSRGRDLLRRRLSRRRGLAAPFFFFGMQGVIGSSGRANASPAPTEELVSSTIAKAVEYSDPLVQQAAAFANVLSRSAKRARLLRIGALLVAVTAILAGLQCNLLQGAADENRPAKAGSETGQPSTSPCHSQ
jgi:RNA polymerase sigma factor (sigma-70 family)